AVAEGRRQIAVERPGADLQQQVSAFGRPLHGLLFGKALGQERVDQRLDERRRDHLTSTPAGAVVGDDVRVPVDAALELVYRTGQGAELWVAGTELPDPPFHLTEPTEGLFGLAMPEAPFRALKRHLHLSPDGCVEMRQSRIHRQEVTQSLRRQTIRDQR